MCSFPLQHGIFKHRDVEHNFIREIDAAVRDFKSQDGRVSSAVVLAGSNYYRMEGGEGRYCAVEPVNSSWPHFYRSLKTRGNGRSSISHLLNHILSRSSFVHRTNFV